MSDADFMREKQRAIERMMSLGGLDPKGERPPSAPPFVKLKGEEKRNDPPHESRPFSLDFGRLDIPFLDNLKKDKDAGLILGLILLLVCENTDKLTLIALLYILL